MGSNYWELPSSWTEEQRQAVRLDASESLLKKHRLSWWPGSTAGLVSAPHCLQPNSGLAGFCSSQKSCVGGGFDFSFFVVLQHLGIRKTISNTLLCVLS